mmetsp:Transcript_49866/g.162298  ORF Transcript_49866/g.162298 Transcript_49866/m.162298 type:complete len:478 (-) Transcript_49866:263-1696(-)
MYGISGLPWCRMIHGLVGDVSSASPRSMWRCMWKYLVAKSARTGPPAPRTGVRRRRQWRRSRSPGRSGGSSPVWTERRTADGWSPVVSGSTVAPPRFELYHSLEPNAALNCASETSPHCSRPSSSLPQLLATAAAASPPPCRLSCSPAAAEPSQTRQLRPRCAWSWVDCALSHRQRTSAGREPPLTSNPLMRGTMASRSGSSSRTSLRLTEEPLGERRRLTCSSAAISASPSLAKLPERRTWRAVALAECARASSLQLTLPPGPRSATSRGSSGKSLRSCFPSRSRSSTGEASSSAEPTLRLAGSPCAERAICLWPGAIKTTASSRRCSCTHPSSPASHSSAGCGCSGASSSSAPAVESSQRSREWRHGSPSPASTARSSPTASSTATLSSEAPLSAHAALTRTAPRYESAGASLGTSTPIHSGSTAPTATWSPSRAAAELLGWLMHRRRAAPITPPVRRPRSSVHRTCSARLVCGA